MKITTNCKLIACKTTNIDEMEENIHHVVQCVNLPCMMAVYNIISIINKTHNVGCHK